MMLDVKTLKNIGCHDYVFMAIVSLLDLFHKHLRKNYIRSNWFWLVKRTNGTSFATITKPYRYNEGGTRRPLFVGNACCLDLAQPLSKHQIISQILTRRMAENGFAPPPPREFCRHILSCRELKGKSFKRCLHSVLRGVSLWEPVTYVT